MGEVRKGWGKSAPLGQGRKEIPFVRAGVRAITGKSIPAGFANGSRGQHLISHRGKGRIKEEMRSVWVGNGGRVSSAGLLDQRSGLGGLVHKLGLKKGE